MMTTVEFWCCECGGLPCKVKRVIDLSERINFDIEQDCLEDNQTKKPMWRPFF